MVPQPGWRGVSVAVAALLMFSASHVRTHDDDQRRRKREERVTITRDGYGAPHVTASSLYALWYGVGYAQAQDRLWQAETLRRSATGTTAEIRGASAVEADVMARTVFGTPARRAQLFAGASREMKTIITALAAGINAWIEEATRTGQLPLEYQALGITPRPWTVDDTIAEAMLLLRTLGEFGMDELTNAAWLAEWTARFGQAEALKVFQDTHWQNDPSAAATVPADGAVNRPRRRGWRGHRFEMPYGFGQAFGPFRDAEAAWKRQLEEMGLTLGPKSNAIAISRRLSADGHALLLGGPQMGYSTPSIIHEMGIHGAGYDITGMNIAGLPGIPVGVGPDFAWSLTSGLSKNNYVYTERLNASGQYLFNGQAQALDCRPETINVRGAAPVVRVLCESVHGPIIATAPGVAFAMKSAVHGFEIKGIEAFHRMMRADSYSEFQRAVASSVYNFNVLYADARGNIAYWHVGRVPEPAAGDPLWLPRDGSGAAEWQGVVPFDEMPHSVNPDQGYLVSWNNKPAPDWDNSVTSAIGMFGPVQRVNTLINRLETLRPGTVSIETLEEINRVAGATADTPRDEGTNSAAPAPTPFQVFASTVPLLDSLLDRVAPAADPRLPQAIAMLRAWDWQQRDENADSILDDPAVVLFNTWWRLLTDGIFRDDLGTAFNENIVANLLHRLVVANPAVPVLHNYLGATPLNTVVTGALVSALDRLQARFGSATPIAWRQPAGAIVWAPLGVGTVPNTLWMNRGTYNQLVHLGQGRRMYATNVVAPGQSGDPRSPHFADQLPLYATWRYKSMVLDRDDLRREAESSITLRVDED